MASKPVSMAQFEDFPQSSKRHYGAAAQGNLGPGLTPVEDSKALPVSLARSRIAHDGAELQEEPTSVATAAKEAAAGAAPMMSSYQAMQAGVSLEDKKRTGKRCVGLPGQQANANGGSGQLFFGAASASAGPRPETLGSLTLGTTKASGHIPGYGGHIPKTGSTETPAPVRSMDKSLIIENYKPYGPGYTGRKGI